MKMRMASKQVELSKEESLKLWKTKVQWALEDLQQALNEPMPTTKFEYFEVKPGDKEYDNAMFEVTESAPIVFKQVIKKPRKK